MPVAFLRFHHHHPAAACRPYHHHHRPAADFHRHRLRWGLSPAALHKETMVWPLLRLCCQSSVCAVESAQSLESSLVLLPSTRSRRPASRVKGSQRRASSSVSSLWRSASSGSSSASRPETGLSITRGRSHTKTKGRRGNLPALRFASALVASQTEPVGFDPCRRIRKYSLLTSVPSTRS